MKINRHGICIQCGKEHDYVIDKKKYLSSNKFCKFCKSIREKYQQQSMEVPIKLYSYSAKKKILSKMTWDEPNFGGY